MRLSVIINATLIIILMGGCNSNVPERKVGEAPAEGEDSSISMTEGGEILLRARRAYEGLQSYTGTIVLQRTANYARGPYAEARKLDVSLDRPVIQLNGLDSNGNEYTIMYDGQATTVSARSLGLDGERHQVKDALVEFSGVSLGASTLLPGILLEIMWEGETIFLPSGDILSAFSMTAELEGIVSIGRSECYRIVCAREMATWTFYVDIETLLIRRVDEVASEEQMRAQQRAGGGGRSGLILSTHTTQHWEIGTFGRKSHGDGNGVTTDLRAE